MRRLLSLLSLELFGAQEITQKLSEFIFLIMSFLPLYLCSVWFSLSSMSHIWLWFLCQDYQLYYLLLSHVFALLASSSMFPKLFSSNNPNKNNFANTNNEHISMHFLVSSFAPDLSSLAFFTFTTHNTTTQLYSFGLSNNILISSLLYTRACSPCDQLEEQCLLFKQLMLIF